MLRSPRAQQRSGEEATRGKGGASRGATRVRARAPRLPVAGRSAGRPRHPPLGARAGGARSRARRGRGFAPSHRARRPRANMPDVPCLRSRSAASRRRHRRLGRRAALRRPCHEFDGRARAAVAVAASRWRPTSGCERGDGRSSARGLVYGRTCPAKMSANLELTDSERHDAGNLELTDSERHDVGNLELTVTREGRTDDPQNVARHRAPPRRAPRRERAVRGPGGRARLVRARAQPIRCDAPRSSCRSRA